MGRYTQRIIDLVYERGCVKREVLVEALMRELGETDEEKVEDSVKKALRRLVRAGIVVRHGRGYYCRPEPRA